MIITKLKGGLGNQMFQYAAARSLALEKSTWVYLDPSFLYEDAKGRWTQRAYELDCFNIAYKFERSGRINFLRSLNHRTRMRKLSESGFWPFSYANFTEQAGGFNESFFNNPVNTYLDGYFQSEKYFVRHRETLLKDFTFQQKPEGRNEELISRLTETNALSIHVRRGDYVSLTSASSFHGFAGEDYYSTAIKDMFLNQPQISVSVVFSDDIEWAKKHITTPVNTIYVDWNSKGYEDLRLMTHCKHHIIANSSFSWWGAWLGEKKDSRIMAPRKWFADANASDKDIIPERWQRI
jgi:hypothetical protein